jgi:thiamine-phosphate pyrophosphorylase
MPKRQTAVPSLWLVSDARNDAALEAVLRKLPRGSGLVFRHYHLAPQQRRERFAELMTIARQCGHIVALSGNAASARHWGADAAYGPPRQLARGPAILRLATAHSLREIATARRSRANAILLSPAFPTRSHPGGKVLGPVKFRLLAARTLLPVIALGGMNARSARRIGTSRWAAVDGLCDEATRSFSMDS